MEKLTEIYNDLSAMGAYLFSGNYAFEDGYDSAVVDIGGYTGIFLDIEKIRTLSAELAAVSHEWAHIVTGTTHSHDAPVRLIAWGETKATRAQIKKLLPYEEMRAAMKSGYREVWELAEYFEVPEDLIRQAIEYYTGPCGLSF